VQGSGCRVQGAGFRVQGSGCRVHLTVGDELARAARGVARAELGEHNRRRREDLRDSVGGSVGASVGGSVGGSAGA
jgi:hypothetical protein